MEDFETFVTERGPLLARTALLLTGQPHLAEELLQETLIRAAERWDRITRDGADPNPYVRQVMATRSIDLWRRRERHSRTEQAAAALATPGPSTVHDEQTITTLILRQALQRLTVRQRTVLVLRHLWDLTEAETASAMGCSTNTVKSLNRQALIRLRALAPDLLDDLHERRPS